MVQMPSEPTGLPTQLKGDMPAEAPAISPVLAADSVAPSSAPAVPSSGPATNIDSLQSFLVDFIVQETGYPADIIDIDWEFEADLGIDSIKKAQMFGELRECSTWIQKPTNS